MSAKTMLLRHGTGERVIHWLVALCFLLTGLSGLAFFHPAFFWLAGLFGGGVWARTLHPFFGVTMAVFFLILVVRVWRDNRITAVDWEWASHMGEILRNRTDHLPPIGKYNLGQKLVTRTAVLAILLLLVSGILIWQPWFAPGFSVDQRRIAVVVHAFSAFVGLVGIIIHVYSAYWTRGSIRSMTQGTVTAAWAKHHHLGWYKEMMEKKV